MTSTQQLPSVESSAGAARPELSRRERIHPRRLLGKLAPRRISAIYLLVFFIILFGLIAPDTFLTETTFRLVFRSGVITCVLALAFLVPLTAGAYDLSVGAVMSLSLGLASYLSIHRDLPTAVAALVAIGAAALCGAVSGFIIVRLHVNSFIATLGVSQLLLGAVLLLSNNTQLVGELPQCWSNLGNNDLLGIPIVVFYPAAAGPRPLVRPRVHPRSGRYLFATGGNPRRRAPGRRAAPTAWSGACSSPAARSPGWPASSSRCRAGLYSSSIGPGLPLPRRGRRLPGRLAALAAPERLGHADRLLRARLRDPGPGPVARPRRRSGASPLFQGVSLIIAVAAGQPARRAPAARAPAASATASVS